MIARTSRSAKAGQSSNDNRDVRAGQDSDLVFDDLLDARFDEQGRLAQVGRGSRQRIAERLDPRPAATSAAELEQAVRKLAEGLDAIERQSRPSDAADASVGHVEVRAPRKAKAASAAADPEFVTHSLDRLESRLEALSQRLQSRAAAAEEAEVAEENAEEPAPTAGEDTSLADEPDFAADSANLLRMAELEAERIQREAEERRRKQKAEAEAKRRAEEEAEAAAEAERLAEEEATEATRRAEEEADEARLKAEAEAKRLAEEEAAEVRRRAEKEAEEARAKSEAEAQAQRIAEEQAAEARRRAEEQAEEARLKAEADAEAKRLAEEEAGAARQRAAEAEAEARRLAEAAERERLARLAEARREAEAAAHLQRQFAEVEARIDALEKSADENQIEPVRGELIAILGEIEGLGRDRDGAAAALDEIAERLGAMESKVNATRNMAGNRLGDIQDRIAGLSDRLDEVEVEVPGFDALRENQGAILERFDRMEGLVHRLASPEELYGRVDALRRQLAMLVSQKDAARIEERILGLADRLDAMPQDLSDAEAIERVELQLGSLATELGSARQQRMSAAADLDRRLSELSEHLGNVEESGNGIAGLDERIADLGERLDEDRRQSGEALARLERGLATLTTVVEQHEDDATADLLAGLMGKVDVLAEAIEAQEPQSTRQDIEQLAVKLDGLVEQIAEQVENMPTADVEPLAQRLDQMQQQLDTLAERAEESSGQLGPFAETLQDISERLSTIGAMDESSPLFDRLDAIEERLGDLSLVKGGPDPRALQTQLDAIVSRLELLKGRSIDPARMNELFDRVDAAMRTLPDDRLEGDEGLLPGMTRAIEEKLERLEQRIIQNTTGAREVSDERFARMERKLDQIGLAYSDDGELLAPEDLAELRGDITSLRRELRSMPAASRGEEGENLSDLLKTVAARLERLPDAPATSLELEAQVERIAELLDDPSHSRLALAHIETSLKTIEERLEETHRALAYRPTREDDEASEGDIEAVAGMARSLSDDVSALKGTAEATQHKTKQALDAVQGTLEAVVKRMAFLERDADRATAKKAGQEDEPEDLVGLIESGEPDEDESAALVERLESAPPATDLAEPKVLEAAPSAQPEPEPGPEPSQARSGGGLLSRLTSRQLLRRATGGRADSFTPEPEESVDESDFPIEPGTDSPLSSALTGAPSSDTHALSGARNKARLAAALGRTPPVISPEPDLDLEEDFLTAARRAAKAASEGDDATGSAAPHTGLRRIFKRSNRSALIAAALAVAVAFAAMQIIRGQMSSGGRDIVAVPQPLPSTLPAEPLASAPPSTVAATQPSAPAPMAEPSADAGGEMASAEAMTGAADTSAAAPPAMASAPPPAADMMPAAPTSEEMAALDSMSGTTSESAPAPASPLELPLDVGSSRLREAALANDPAADFEVASRYAEGRGVTQDMTTAVSWYERAAAAGLAPAQYRLGSIYEKGLGVKKDLAKAQSWYRRAAAAGNVKAMHNLAVLYAEGAGGDPDLEQAAVLFQQAAEHGVRDSQFNLAILHARGLGVSQDLMEAYKWFAVAATSGDEESAKRRDIIGAALSEADLGKAQAAAAAFEPLPLSSKANEVPVPEGGWNDKQDSSSVDVKPDAGAGHIGSDLSENDLVALVQKLLADKGFDPGPTDGLLGNQTMEAIRQFQEQAGMPRTGTIDPGLVAALQAAG